MSGNNIIILINEAFRPKRFFSPGRKPWVYNTIGENMSHTYSSLFVHCVWGTKRRIPYLTDDIRLRVYKYIEAIVEHQGAETLAIGGIEDHVHLLVSVKQTMIIPDFMRVIKTNSSSFVRQTLQRDFAWQEGYGVFSVSVSMVPTVMRYIERQEEHHKKRSFEDEYLLLLEKHGIEHGQTP